MFPTLYPIKIAPLAMAFLVDPMTFAVASDKSRTYGAPKDYNVGEIPALCICKRAHRYEIITYQGSCCRYPWSRPDRDRPNDDWDAGQG
jgi:hypothetical protein